jgi:hypothetical protein
MGHVTFLPLKWSVFCQITEVSYGPRFLGQSVHKPLTEHWESAVERHGHAMAETRTNAYGRQKNFTALSGTQPTGRV